MEKRLVTFPDRLFVVSVGTTALSAELGVLTATDDSADLRQCARQFLSGYPPSPRLHERVLRAHQDLWAAAWPSGQPIWDHRYATSAEMVSSYYLLRVQVLGTLAPEGKAPILFRVKRDRIILLSSNTPQGEFCARINAQLMHDHLFEQRCDCGSVFDSGHLKCAKECVQIKILAGLEGSETGFNNIPAHLRELWKCHAKPGETQVLVNITGGYKGIIPALTYMCVESKSPASLYYMHENMKSAASIYIRGGAVEHCEEDVPTFS